MGVLPTYCYYYIVPAHGYLLGVCERRWTVALGRLEHVINNEEENGNFYGESFCENIKPGDQHHNREMSTIYITTT